MSDPDVARSARGTIASLFGAQAGVFPDRVALEDGDRRLSFAELDERSRRLAAWLTRRGAMRGDRIAVLSENRLEYAELLLAAARLGASVACQNWRLTARELGHCLDLVEPRLTLVSPRHRGLLATARASADDVIIYGDVYEESLEKTTPVDTGFDAAEPEDPLLILYTSGTTGLPKGAIISHRAEIARNLVMRAEFGLQVDDTYAAWTPFFHMGGCEYSLATLMSGGKVIVVDGFDAGRLADIVAAERLGWFVVVPGMILTMIAELRRRDIRPKGVRFCGVMADLVPPAEIAEITGLLDAPYANTFGSTETGSPPGSPNFIPIGVAPVELSKRQSRFCEIRLVGEDDREVPLGTPGELCIRSATLFSGYWGAPAANTRDFRGGWFHMGDVFVRNADGTLDFVDRAKYLIKSGSENIYPAEIERVLAQDPRVAEAAVVRCADEKWGEVPIAFVARNDEDLSAEELYARCRAELAGYKQPKGIRFIAYEDFPRSATGKVKRDELERRLAEPVAERSS